MRNSAECPVNLAVESGLSAASGAYAQRRIALDLRLAATTHLGSDDAALTQSITTIFRGLPARLAVGSTLSVWTRDMAGGDIELGWECVEEGESMSRESVASSLAQGRYGDILELAVRGLEEICRARTADRQGADLRYVFLLPSAMNRLQRA